MPGHAYPVPADASHPHPQRPAEASAVDHTTTHHGRSAEHGAGLQGIEPQLGSLRMQLGGYHATSSQYDHFAQQGWPAATSYPFMGQTAPAVPPAAHEGGSPAPGSHSRTGGEPRGEDSPMMGVCVQQSPVASHWPAQGSGRVLTHRKDRARRRPVHGSDRCWEYGSVGAVVISFVWCGSSFSRDSRRGTRAVVCPADGLDTVGKVPRAARAVTDRGSPSPDLGSQGPAAHPGDRDRDSWHPAPGLSTLSVVGECCLLHLLCVLSAVPADPGVEETERLQSRSWSLKDQHSGRVLPSSSSLCALSHASRCHRGREGEAVMTRRAWAAPLQGLGW